MDDVEIIALYKERDEAAIAEAKKKYGENCRIIAYNILKNRQDTEEILSDTLLTSWNTVPDEEPRLLGPYLYKITRNLALKKYRDSRRKKRAGDVVLQSIDEIEECLPSSFDVESQTEGRELSGIINAFLSELETDARRVFVLRYFAGMKEADIAGKLGVNRIKVRSSLKKSRGILSVRLKKEGYDYE